MSRTPLKARIRVTRWLLVSRACARSHSTLFRMSLDPNAASSPIRRNPSNLAKELSKLNLPDPEQVTRHAREHDDSLSRDQVDSQLHKLQFSPQTPEAVSRAAADADSVDAEALRHDMMAETFSDLDLPEPERLTIARLRADGAKTPPMMCVAGIAVPDDAVLAQRPNLPSRRRPRRRSRATSSGGSRRSSARCVDLRNLAPSLRPRLARQQGRAPRRRRLSLRKQRRSDQREQAQWSRS